MCEGKLWSKKGLGIFWNSWDFTMLSCPGVGGGISAKSSGGDVRDKRDRCKNKKSFMSEARGHLLCLS